MGLPSEPIAAPGSIRLLAVRSFHSIASRGTATVARAVRPGERVNNRHTFGAYHHRVETEWLVAPSKLASPIDPDSGSCEQALVSTVSERLLASPMQFGPQTRIPSSAATVAGSPSSLVLSASASPNPAVITSAA